jgi:hypothetical protein
LGFDPSSLQESAAQRAGKRANAVHGFVTLPCREREMSTPQELSGRCDCGPPRSHGVSAKRTVRLGGDEMALDVEGLVDSGVRGKEISGLNPGS